MMIGVKRIFSYEATIPILITVLLFTLSAYPWVARALSQTPDRIWIPFHNSTGDYPTYVTAVKQGLDGHLLTYNMFAIAPHKPGLYFIFYSMLGLIGRALGSNDAHQVYHVSRFVLGIMWCGVIYLILKKVLATRLERTLAYFFILTSSSFPRWVVNYGVPELDWYLSWWTEFDPTKRFAFLPHYLAGHILFGIALLLYLKAVESHRMRYIFLSSIAGWFAGLIHPPSLMIMLLIIPIYSTVVYGLQSIRFWGVFSLVSITSPLLMSWQANQFPWNNSWAHEGLSFAVPFNEVLLALGPVSLLAAGALVLLRKKKYVLLCVLWIFLSLSMLLISKWILDFPYRILHIIPLSNVRFLQTALWVPLGILAATTLGLLRKRWGMLPVAICLALYTGIVAFGYPSSIKKQISGLVWAEDYHAPTLQWFSVVQALNDIKHPGPVLTLQWAGSILPTYISRKSYTGNPIITPDHTNQMGNAYRFFTGLPVCEAYAIVRDGNVSAVLFGFDEAVAGDAATHYPFLRPIKSAGGNVLYEVISWKGC